MPCGTPEQFFLLPEGSTCAEVCHSPDLLVCDNVAGGCLCKQLPSAGELAAQRGRMDGGQDGIDSGQ